MDRAETKARVIFVANQLSRIPPHSRSSRYGSHLASGKPGTLDGSMPASNWDCADSHPKGQKDKCTVGEESTYTAQTPTNIDQDKMIGPLAIICSGFDSHGSLIASVTPASVRRTLTSRRWRSKSQHSSLNGVLSIIDPEFRELGLYKVPSLRIRVLEPTHLP